MSPAERKHQLDKRKSERYYTDPRRICVGQFFNNTLIKYMAMFPNWTMSDKKKMPLDASYYVKYRGTSKYPFKAFSYIRDDNGKVKVKNGIKQTNALVTLSELDPKHTPELDFVNRAYRMDAREDHVICIDIESTCVVDYPEIVNTLWKLPAMYRERSMHDGFHLLLYIPKDFINSKNQYIMQRTNIKGPQNLFEFINNEHFITLTHKMTTQVKCPLHVKKGHRYTTYSDPKQRKALKKFLAQLVEFDRPREKRREANEIDIGTGETIKIASIVPDYLKPIAQSFPILYEKNDENIDPDDYNDDHSAYEFTVEAEVKLQWYAITKIGELAGVGLDPNNPDKKTTMSDLDYLTYLVSSNTNVISWGHNRKKWHTKRDGLPWLLWDSNRSNLSVFPNYHKINYALKKANDIEQNHQDELIWVKGRVNNVLERANYSIHKLDMDNIGKYRGTDLEDDAKEANIINSIKHPDLQRYGYNFAKYEYSVMSRLLNFWYQDIFNPWPRLKLDMTLHSLQAKAETTQCVNSDNFRLFAYITAIKLHVLDNVIRMPEQEDEQSNQVWRGNKKLAWIIYASRDLDVSPIVKGNVESSKLRNKLYNIYGIAYKKLNKYNLYDNHIRKFVENYIKNTSNDEVGLGLTDLLMKVRNYRQKELYKLLAKYVNKYSNAKQIINDTIDSDDVYHILDIERLIEKKNAK